jgi:hypothetical protein
VKDLSLVQWVFENYVGAAKDLEELNMPICELFNNFFAKSVAPIVDDTLDEPCYEPSDDTSHESYNEAGAISISINNNIKDLKHIVHLDQEPPKSDSNPEPISKADQAGELFNELWAMYPHKKGKGQVKNAHKLLLLKHGKDKMVRAIQRYIAYVEAQRKGGFMLQYQNGSTFFHTGYVDYLADEYVMGAVAPSSGNKGTGKTGSTGNQFHNFEKHGQNYSDDELSAKLRGKGGGLGGSSGGIGARNRASGE